MICLQAGEHVRQTNYSLLGELWPTPSLFLSFTFLFVGVLVAVFWFPLGVGLCLLDRRVRCTRCGLHIEEGLCGWWVSFFLPFSSQSLCLTLPGLWTCAEYVFPIHRCRYHFYDIILLSALVINIIARGLTTGENIFKLPKTDQDLLQWPTHKITNSLCFGGFFQLEQRQRTSQRTSAIERLTYKMITYFGGLAIPLTTCKGLEVTKKEYLPKSLHVLASSSRSNNSPIGV